MKNIIPIIFPVLIAILAISAKEVKADMHSIEAKARTVIETFKKCATATSTEAYDRFDSEENLFRQLVTSTPSAFDLAIQIIRKGENSDISNLIAMCGIAGLKDDKLIKKALDLLNDKDQNLRRAAICALTPKRKHGFVLSDGTVFHDNASEWKLGYKKGNPFVDFEISDKTIRNALLLRLQKEENQALRCDLVWSLQFSQELDPTINAEFIGVLKKEADSAIGTRIVEALMVGDRKCNGLDIITDLLKNSGDKNVRSEIAVAMGTDSYIYLSPNGQKKIYEALLNVLWHDSNDEVKSAACFSLGRLFPVPKSLVMDLKKVLPDIKSESIRHQIENCITQDKDEENKIGVTH